MACKLFNDFMKDIETRSKEKITKSLLHSFTLPVIKADHQEL